MVQGRRVGGNYIINTNVYYISFFRCLSTISFKQRGIKAEVKSAKSFGEYAGQLQ